MKHLKIILGCLLALLSACSHSLEIKNLSEFSREVYRPKSNPRIAISTSSSDEAILKIAHEIRNVGRMAGIEIDLTSDSLINAKDIDYIVRLHGSPKYEGSGWNFLINWPGFLIFTPAWHGFVYGVTYNLEASILDPQTDTRYSSFSKSFNLDVRHADISRTWTEIGWLEVSLIPFIGGIVFTQYDDDVTPLVIEASKQTIAKNMLNEILNNIPHGLKK